MKTRNAGRRFAGPNRGHFPWLACVALGVLGACGRGPSSEKLEDSQSIGSPPPDATAPAKSTGGGGAAAAPPPQPTGSTAPPQQTGAGGSAQPAEKPIRTVLLIPGTTITGDYFDVMAARLTADGFDPVVFVPPDLFTESLATGAQRIADRVAARLAESGEPRLDIVAECDGGVATRYYLEVLGGAPFVDQAITFVSAHHGTWASPLGKWVAGYQALADIVPGSPFLTKLNSSTFPAGLKLTSIYSCNDELMYPYDTSVVEGATNVLFCDHYIDHFGGFWDSLVYGRILTTLQGNGALAPTSY